MSAHLLQIGAERLATLPSGVLVYEDVSGYASRTDIRDREVWLLGIPEPRRAASVGPLHLVLTDTVTAAVVAACIVRPWSDNVVLGRQVIPGVWYSDVIALVGKAERMEPLTADDLDTLARLARAAMEVA